MTDTTPTEEMQARIEQLRASRDKTAAPSRRHSAEGARIAAAGFSLATMLGLVGVMGYAGRSTSTAAQPAPLPAPAPQIVVVLHQNPATTPTGASTISATNPTATSNAATAAAPIPLTARPVVQQAPATQTPIAKTHGSR